MTEFSVIESEVAYEGRFALANLSMLDHRSGLVDRLLAELAPFQSKLADVRLETASPDLTRAHFACHVFGFAGAVRVFADRVEVRCSESPASENLLRIAEAAIRAVAASAQGTPFNLTQHTFALSSHCEPKGFSTAEFLEKLVASRSLGGDSPVSRSATLTFGQNGPRLSALFAAEPSVQLAGGTFLRLVVSFDARSLAIGEAAKRGVELVRLIERDILNARLADVEFFAE